MPCYLWHQPAIIALAAKRCKLGAIDLALVNATPARAEYLDFADAILFSAQSYLIGAHCDVRDRASLDREGILVAVTCFLNPSLMTSPTTRQAPTICIKAIF